MKVHPPVWLLASAALAVALAKFIPLASFTAPFIIIVFIFVAGAVFLLLAGLDFVRNKTTVNPHTPEKTAILVTSGVYRITRNPMYLGMLFLLVSLILWLGALSSFAAAIGFVFVITQLQIKLEEGVLTELFGDDFRTYIKRVPRWLIR